MQNKKPTIQDIADKLKLSKTAVSFALNGSPMVSAKTRQKVAKAARAMGYSKNALVSSMMSSIKRGGVGRFSETIALINGNTDERALTNHPTLPKYCAGIREEAGRLGYTINEFWLHDPRLNGEIFARMLRSRGIRGGIILGHSFGTVFPASFSDVWKNFYFVSAGIKTRRPNLEMVSADHYAITYGAMMKAAELGYKRAGIVLNGHIDALVDGRLVAGYLRAQMQIAPRAPIPPFLDEDTRPDYAKRLCAWLDKYSPDVVFYLLDSTRELLNSRPKKRHKISLIQLEKRGDVPNWQGMEQNNDIVGKIALRRLADMLNRTSSVVGENANLVTLVPPTWRG